MNKEYKLIWDNIPVNEAGMRLVWTRILCEPELLNVVLNLMPKHKYEVECLSDKSISYGRKNINQAIYNTFANNGIIVHRENSGYNTINSRYATSIVNIDEHYKEEGLVSYEHFYLSEPFSDNPSYYDRIDKYTISNRKLLINDTLNEI